MSNKSINIITGLVVILTIFQLSIPSLTPLIHNETTIKIISASVMFLVSGLTNWKQAISKEIDNKALWPTRIVALIAIVGGFNELLAVIPISDVTGQWIRFVITFITMGLNVISKLQWPTQETKSLI